MTWANQEEWSLRIAFGKVHEILIPRAESTSICEKLIGHVRKEWKPESNAGVEKWLALSFWAWLLSSWEKMMASECHPQILKRTAEHDASWLDNPDIALLHFCSHFCQYCRVVLYRTPKEFLLLMPFWVIHVLWKHELVRNIYWSLELFAKSILGISLRSKNSFGDCSNTYSVFTTRCLGI